MAAPRWLVEIDNSLLERPNAEHQCDFSWTVLSLLKNNAVVTVVEYELRTGELVLDDDLSFVADGFGEDVDVVFSDWFFRSIRSISRPIAFSSSEAVSASSWSATHGVKSRSSCAQYSRTSCGSSDPKSGIVALRNEVS